MARIATDKIQSTIGDLTGQEAENREQSFRSLCFYRDEEEIAWIFDFLLGRGDTESIYWLVRYLVEIRESAAHLMLFRLVRSDDEIIREQARLGIMKIDAEKQEYFFIQMLEFSEKEDIQFAVQRLGQLRQARAVRPLLKLLKERPDADLRVLIIKALGMIRDKRAISELQKIAEKDSGIVQAEALVVLQKLSSLLQGPFLMRALDSGDARVRRFAYLTLLRFRHIKWEKILARCLHKESDNELIVQVLSDIRSIRVSSFFDLILNWAAHAEDYNIRMLSLTLLKRLSGNTVRSYLVKATRSGEKEKRVLALRLMVPLRLSTAEKKILLKYLRSESGEIRLIALNALARSDIKADRDPLWQCIEHQDRDCYAAAAALAESVHEQDLPRVRAWMSEWKERSPAMVQVFLRMFLRVPERAFKEHFCQEEVKSLMASEDTAIRYLAVRCYSRMQTEGGLQKLLSIAGSDLSLSVRQAALDALYEIVEKNPVELTRVLAVCLPIRELFSVAARIFRNVTVNDSKALAEIVHSLFETERKYREVPALGSLFDQRRLRVLLRYLAKKQKSLYLDILKNEAWEEEEEIMLVHVLTRSRIAGLHGLRPGFMADRYETSNSEVKKAYLQFFLNLQVREKVLETSVYRGLASESDAEIRRLLENVIASWFGRGQEVTG